MRSALDTVRRGVLDGLDVVHWAASPGAVLGAMVPSRCMPHLVLNERPSVWRAPPTPEVLGRSLQALRHLLESEAVIDGRVDYGTLKSSPSYAEFAQQTQVLRHIYPVSFDTDAERVAFWINMYNALCIHGVIALGLKRSAMEMPSFFARVAYRVGEWTFTPNDMLNGVLRRGRCRPDGFSRQFRPGDPRLAYAPAQVDPRMHGALVCLARSCPPVGFYSAARLDAQLQLAADHLIDGTVELDNARRELQLPLQFFYYSEDFGDRAAVERFVLRHLPPERRAAVESAFREGWKIRWRPYDWAINSVAAPRPQSATSPLRGDASAQPARATEAWSEHEIS